MGDTSKMARTGGRMKSTASKMKASLGGMKGGDWGTVAALGMVALGAYMVVRVIRSWTGEAEREAAWASYQSEMEELIAFETAIADAGREPTEYEEGIMGIQQHWIQEKEWSAEQHGFWTYLSEAIDDFFWKYGIYALGGWAGWKGIKYLVKYYRDRKGPPPGGYTCPVDRQTFSTSDQLDAHVRAHQIVVDPQSRLAAQASYLTLPIWTQNSVAAMSEAYSQVHYSWDGLEESTLGEILVQMSQAKNHGEGSATAMVILEETIKTLVLVPI